MSTQQRLQDANAEFHKIQTELSAAVEARQKLDAQLSENELVKKEFDELTPENIVFKQIGPVLVKQDQKEAENNVKTRIEFIKSEIQRVEEQLKTIEARSEKKREEIIQLQTTVYQQQQQEQPSGSA